MGKIETVIKRDPVLTPITRPNTTYSQLQKYLWSTVRRSPPQYRSSAITMKEEEKKEEKKAEKKEEKKSKKKADKEEEKPFDPEQYKRDVKELERSSIQ